MDTSGIEDSYPLTPLQMGMLFNYESSPGSGVDIVQIVCSLHERLDASALESAWKSVGDRNPVLRTSFHRERDGAPVQIVHRSFHASIQLYNWAALSPFEIQKRLTDQLERDRRDGFRLENTPLIRLAVFTTDAGHDFLALTLHHIILDGQAFPLLLEDLFSAYDGLRSGREVPPKEPVPFRTYIDWVGRQDHGGAESFWRGYLEGFTAPTPLPPETGRCPLKEEFLGFGRRELRLSSSALSSLHGLAEVSGVGMSTVFRAAWGLLLGRYSGTTDVVFGEARSCRRSTVDGADRIFGCCINTVPVRICIPPAMPVIEWLRQVRQEHAAVRKYEHTPLGRIRGWSEVPGGGGLFETLLVYDRHGLGPLMRSRGESWRDRELKVLSHTNFPLVLEVQGEEGVAGLTYSLARFTHLTAERILCHLQTILLAMASCDGRRLHDVPLLTAEEERQLLSEWNAAQEAGITLRCVHELIEVQTDLTPEAVAVRSGNDRLTYRELNRRANVLARHISALGVGPEEVVGLAIPRSCEMVVALLAILKAGGAYLPLDSALPGERVRFILADGDPVVVVTTRDLAPQFDTMGLTIVVLENVPGIDNVHVGSIAPNPPRRADLDNSAYVIYTSGSTGKPKGTVVLHRGLSNYLLWCTEAYGVREGCGSIVGSPLSFDLTVTGLFAPLLCGRTVFLLPESAGPEDLSIALQESTGCSLVKITPAHLELLITLIPRTAAERLVATFVIGGENLKADLASRWQKRAPGISLFNEYGPTETVVGCAVYRIPEGVQPAGSIPIGRPIANTHLYVLDPEMRPVPIGVTAELYIGGAGVARGYLNRPALTEDRFVRDPFSGDPKSLLFRSGDLVRSLPDGTLEFVGRTDDQVKIRGYRVEPGEIESVLNEHGGVRETVVIVRKGPNGDQRLEAYYVSHGDSPPHAGELRKHARNFLPEYMVPAVFIPLDHVPLNSRGKVDRSALLEFGSSRTGQRKNPGPPTTSTEETLVHIWEELLGVKWIETGDNFFDRGGHSLLVMQLLSRIREQWGIELRISEVFDAPTLAGLASTIDRRFPAETGRLPEVHPRQMRNANSNPGAKQIDV